MLRKRPLNADGYKIHLVQVTSIEPGWKHKIVLLLKLPNMYKYIRINDFVKQAKDIILLKAKEICRKHIT